MSISGSVCRNCLRRKLRAETPKAYSTSPTRPRPPRCAIIGAGPAGFYAAHRMLQKLPAIKIDMYEALPTPFGLVRYGVAPDHPEVKNCTHTFAAVAAHADLSFMGNVALGAGPDRLPLSVLMPHYDALFFAYGASKDRRLGILGEDMQGIHSARAFVGWYNGLPEYSDLNPKLDDQDAAVIIGQGNVALDVARILLSPVDRLRHTEITEQALQTLSQSRITRVSVVGRRGPLQAPYTTKEVRELLNMEHVSFSTTPSDDPFMRQPDQLPRQVKRLAQVLAKGSSADKAQSLKHWELKCLLNPARFEASSADKTTVGAVVFDQMQYTRDPFTQSLTDMDLIRAAQVIKRNDSGQEHIHAGLVFRSIGYQAEAIDGLDDIGVPFDAQLGIMPNDLYGRVLTRHRGPRPLTAGHVPGIYCAGWVKRGPTGVIATTMDDAFISADALISDWNQGVPFIDVEAGPKSGWDAVKDEAARRGIRRVSWADWETIDREEQRRGRVRGKEREKCKSVAEMLSILDA